VTAPEVAVLDLDGTLVDSVYVHAIAWREAFREVGLDVPTYRLHRAIGMGGDRLVSAVAGGAAEDAVGDVVRDLHGKIFEARLADVHQLEGASELLEACRDAGLRIVLASSSQPETTEKVLSLVDSSHLIEAVVPGSEGPSKPAPDLVQSALDRVGSGPAFLVGDAVWDVESAERAGIPCVALLTGGYSEAELRDAGAVVVDETPRTLAGHLREVLEAVDRAGAGRGRQPR
jgi:phosphoglycolate phosphatase-like HAD superfamily hydrolase